VAIDRPALGRFKHEAAAVDPVNNHVYLSEDEGDGRFYRYVPDALTPEGFADLGAGRLEVAAVDPDGNVTWHAVPDPSAASAATRAQVAASTVFRGGEGLFYHAGTIYLTTKGDNRVWAYDVAASTIRTIYDAATAANPILTGVDNVVVTCCGDVLVAEDGGDMQIVAILPDGTLKPVIQVDGQTGSEITGPAFNPAGDRLYFSSQRANATPSGLGIDGGLTYEVTGPFVIA
jgi:secreted PhoX family phosphatase